MAAYLKEMENYKKEAAAFKAIYDVQHAASGYTYDAMGFVVSATNTAGEVTRYLHDFRGNVVETRVPGKVIATTRWNDEGQKIVESDVNGMTSHWTYDDNGRMLSATGRDDSTTVFAYDNAGQLISAVQAAKGQVITYDYDTIGQTTSISEIVSGINASPAYSKLSTYAYDLAGNRTVETTTVDTVMVQDNLQRFDVYRRLVSVVADDHIGLNQTLAYEYDGFGNRIRFTSSAPGKGAAHNEDGYFMFDALNRTIVMNALDAAGTVGETSVRRTFDSAGNLASSTVGVRTESYTYDAMNRLSATLVNNVLAFRTSYDLWGRTVADAEQPDAPVTADMAPPPPLPPAGPPTPPSDNSSDAQEQYQIALRTYEEAVKAYPQKMENYKKEAAAFKAIYDVQHAANGYERHLRVYDAAGRLTKEQALQDSGHVKTQVSNDSFDHVGNVTSYHVDSLVGEHVLSTYTNTYRMTANGLVIDVASGYLRMITGDLAGQRGDTSSNQSIYDANGVLVGLTYHNNGVQPATGIWKKSFVTDARGAILISHEGYHQSPDMEQRQILSGGELLLRYSRTVGSFHKDVEDEIKDFFWKIYDKDASQSALTPHGLHPTGASAASGGTVQALEGETLSSLALRVYGNADDWHVLADANNLGFGTVLQAGQVLVTPAAAVDSDSKLSFNNGKLIGNLSPNLPPPPTPKDYGFLVLLLIVVLIVICIVAPYATPAAAAIAGSYTAAVPFIAGAIVGAAASFAVETTSVAAARKTTSNGKTWAWARWLARSGADSISLASIRWSMPPSPTW